MFDGRQNRVICFCMVIGQLVDTPTRRLPTHRLVVSHSHILVNLQMLPLLVVICFCGYFEHRKQINTKMQLSRPTRKPEPMKAFKALVIFNMYSYCYWREEGGYRSHQTWNWTNHSFWCFLFRPKGRQTVCINQAEIWHGRVYSSWVRSHTPV